MCIRERKKCSVNINAVYLFIYSFLITKHEVKSFSECTWRFFFFLILVLCSSCWPQIFLKINIIKMKNRDYSMVQGSQGWGRSSNDEGTCFKFLLIFLNHFFSSQEERNLRGRGFFPFLFFFFAMCRVWCKRGNTNAEVREKESKIPAA